MEKLVCSAFLLPFGLISKRIMHPGTERATACTASIFTLYLTKWTYQEYCKAWKYHFWEKKNPFAFSMDSYQASMENYFFPSFSKVVFRKVLSIVLCKKMIK